MTFSKFSILEEVISMTERILFSVKDNIYRETLKKLLHIFNNIFILDGNGNKIKIHCSTGKTDRPTGKFLKDNNLVLPFITINETGSADSITRRRTANLLVNESIWDEKENRSKRVLSIAPRAIDITYQINIWAKYNSDLDQIRYSIFNLFNPGLAIKTKYSDFTKAFITTEFDINSQEASDTSDRLVQKTISIKVETYLPSPKFLFQSTGGIKLFNTDVILIDKIKE